jgi:hypothetical protein
MRRPALALAVLLAACAAPPTQPAASCPDAAVRLNGGYYFSGGEAPASAAGSAFATVQRKRSCIDVVVSVEGELMSPPEDWIEGDASGIEAGTTLYSAIGAEPGQRLVALSDRGGWIYLERGAEPGTF